MKYLIIYICANAYLLVCAYEGKGGGGMARRGGGGSVVGADGRVAVSDNEPAVIKRGKIL